jgi:hypothetical protein
MTPLEKIKAIQKILGVADDGDFRVISRRALENLIARVGETPVTGKHQGLASSFADPDDVRRFRACKAQGKSDQECFKVGDNGIGKWGADTTLPIPMCALPREDWAQLPRPQGTMVKVTILSNGLSVVCQLQDTMPARANITNGAIIDLNPAAAKALNLQPPFLKPCVWEWSTPS